MAKEKPGSTCTATMKPGKGETCLELTRRLQLQSVRMAVLLSRNVLIKTVTPSDISRRWPGYTTLHVLQQCGSLLLG